MALSDLELVQLAQQAQEGRRGEQGPPGIGIRNITQLDGQTFIIALTDGQTKEITLPSPKDGEVGAPGPRGATGERGSDGRDGRQGPQGAPGADGVDGRPGRAIENAVVSNGRLLLELNDGDIIDAGPVIGPTGAPGSTGLTGPQGLPGRDGNTILSGNGAPPDSLGSDGDFYIDLLSPDLAIYGPKTGGGWLRFTNLKLQAPPNHPQAHGVGRGATAAAGGGGGGSRIVATTNVLLNPGARKGDAPTFADLSTLKTQMGFNWFTENELGINKTAIAQNTDDISKLNAVRGIPHAYDLLATDGTDIANGQFSTNSADPVSGVTEIKISGTSKNGFPLPLPADGDTFVMERRSDGAQARFDITDVTTNNQFNVKFESSTVANMLTTGAEYDVFIFPTATTPVVVATSAPTSPDLGDMWFNTAMGDDQFVLYIWDGSNWKSVPLPPSTQALLDDKVSKSGDEMTGQLEINVPRLDTGANNSFVIRGNIGGKEGEVVLKDYRYGKNDSGGDALVQYFGGTYSPNAIANVKYVTDNAMALDGSNAASAVEFAGTLEVDGLIGTKSDLAVRGQVQAAGGVVADSTVQCNSFLLVDKNRTVDPAPSNSFIVRGNIGATENTAVFFDYREPLGDNTGTKMIYRGPMTGSEEIVTKAYVDAAGMGTAGEGHADDVELKDLTLTGQLNVDQYAKFKDNITVDGSTNLNGSTYLQAGLTINSPRVESTSNSFIIKGNKGNTEGQSIFYDYREPAGGTLDTKIIYAGPMVQDNEIVTKAYVDARSLPYTVEEYNTRVISTDDRIAALEAKIAELEAKLNA